MHHLVVDYYLHFHDFFAFLSSKQQIKKPIRFEHDIKRQYISVNPRLAEDGFYCIDRHFF